jgi:hypothetical protein
MHELLIQEMRPNNVDEWQMRSMTYSVRRGFLGKRAD